MPLGTGVGLGPGDTVLDGDPTPPCTARQFLAHVYCDQTAGWIKMALAVEVYLCPGHIVFMGTQLPPAKGAQQPPSFRPMSIVAKWLPISASAELLFNIISGTIFDGLFPAYAFSNKIHHFCTGSAR